MVRKGFTVTVQDKAWQRVIRENLETKAIKNGFVKPEQDIKQSVVKRISYDLAKTIILEYEWLGKMGQGRFCYGIFFEEQLAGVVCFGLPASLTAGNLCGETLSKDRAICLERGACVWWAHPHSASRLINKAVDDLAKTTNYRIFYAYSDEEAGEIGTVYQACGWYYIGRMTSGGSQTKLVNPDGKILDSRHVIEIAKRHGWDGIGNRTKAREFLLSKGWGTKKTKPKGKYCTFRGTRKEIQELKNALVFECQPYPKRTQGGITK